MKDLPNALPRSFRTTVSRPVPPTRPITRDSSAGLGLNPDELALSPSSGETLDPYDYNLRHIRAVAAIAAAGSISGAVGTVSLSQPALTQGLARLETLLNTRLFERRPGGVVTTATGKVLAARSDDMFEQLARGLRQAKLIGRGFAEAEQLLTMTQIRALLALSDSGNFETVAAQTGFSRSALSRTVRDLEHLVGVPLTERLRRGVSLTEAGRRAARGFRIAISIFRAALAEIATLEGDTVKEVILVGTVGALPLTRASLLPRALAEFRSKFPDATVRVIEASHRELIDQLRDGHLDLVVGALAELPSGVDLRQETVIEEELVVVARAGHPLVTANVCDVFGLAQYDWVVGLPGTPRRRHWENLFEGTTIPPAPVECGSMPTVRELLLTSDMLSLLPPDQVRIEMAAGIMAILDISLDARFQLVGTTVRADWRPTAAQRAFTDEIQRIARCEFRRRASEGWQLPERAAWQSSH